jgi:hypothetical protein
MHKALDSIPAPDPPTRKRKRERERERIEEKKEGEEGRDEGRKNLPKDLLSVVCSSSLKALYLSPGSMMKRQKLSYG